MLCRGLQALYSVHSRGSDSGMYQDVTCKMILQRPLTAACIKASHVRCRRTVVTCWRFHTAAPTVHMVYGMNKEIEALTVPARCLLCLLFNTVAGVGTEVLKFEKMLLPAS